MASLRSLRIPLAISVAAVATLALTAPARRPANPAAAAAQAIDSRLAGKTAAADTFNLFSSLDFAAHKYVRNPNLWARDWPLTCVSVWNSANADGTGGNRGAGTAIDPRHIVLAHHFTQIYAEGTVFDFVTADNRTISRKLKSAVQIGATDIEIGTLDADLPPEIAPARILAPAVDPSFLPPGTPVLFTNQAKSARVADLVSFQTTIIRTSTNPARQGWTPPPGTAPAGMGDSGSPIFVILGGEPVLLACFYTGNGGPWISAPANMGELKSAIGRRYSLIFASF